MLKIIYNLFRSLFLSFQIKKSWRNFNRLDFLVLIFIKQVEIIVTNRKHGLKDLNLLNNDAN